MSAISVIIPAYNQGHYLSEAVQSVLRQTYSDFEVIIVDDGSTDNTSSVAAGFSDHRIRYIHQDNHGLSAARNTGICNTCSPYVTFLDSDDLFLPNKLALLLVELSKQPGLGLVAGGAHYIDEDSHPLKISLDPGLPEDSAQLLLGNPFHVGSILMRRSWLDEVGLFDTSLRACEDWDMWLRLAKAGCRMRSLEQPVSMYRIHGGQMTRGAKRMREAMLAVLDKIFSAPDLAESWRALRAQAYGAAYIKAAARAYHARAYEDAMRDLDQAVRLDQDLLNEDACRLAGVLSEWADAPLTGDALVYLDRVYKNLPESLSVLRQHRRQHLARKALQIAFESYHHGGFARTRSLILRALCYEPGWLRQRGVVSLLLRSCVYAYTVRS